MNKEKSILNEIWDELYLSLEVSGHPYHIFSISSIYNNKPDARSVVLRSVDKKNQIISFHTDSRSKKILHIKENNNICALFYDQPKKTQLRIHGTASIVNDEELIYERWEQSEKMSKLCYLNKYAPGSKLDNPKDYLQDSGSLNNIDSGIDNFMVVNININIIDWLNLNHKGHERIIINISDKENTIYNWSAP